MHELNENAVKGLFTVGILLVALMLVLTGLASTTQPATTPFVLNESMVANTSTPSVLGFTPVLANNINISLANGSTTLIFVEGADFTIVDVSGTVTWLNTTGNDTNVNASYTYFRDSDSTFKAVGNTSQAILNITTQLPVVGTVLGVVLIIGGIVILLRRLREVQ